MRIVTFMLLAAIVASCNKSSLSKPTQSALSSSTISNASENGRASARDVYYDGKLFTVNMMELSDKAAGKISTHAIYASNDLDDPQDFNSVISAIPTDDFNALWLQKLIVFNPGFTPHQFFSDDEVLNAASGSNPEITLVNTGEIYRCSVIGPK
jgi:hypothetical protein